MFQRMEKVHRLYFEQALRPAQGDRFQPTGFADLGAAVYELPDGRRKLLLESAQSMANRFEAALLGPDGDLSPEFEGLPYIKARLSGDAVTFVTSLTEPHRINSPWFISDDNFKAEFSKRSSYTKGSPLDWRKIGKAIFFYDSNSLLHGCFLANLEDGRIKAPRALSAFIEADNPREALSGGVKFNPIDPTGKIRAANYDKDVYGNVPFQRMEYTAEKITAYFSLDLSLLRGYGLEKPAFELLLALGLYKVRHFLDAGARLRTACDLVPDGPVLFRDLDGFSLPGKEELLRTVREKIGECAKAGLFAQPPVTSLEIKAVIKKDTGKAAEEEEEPVLSEGEDS